MVSPKILKSECAWKLHLSVGSPMGVLGEARF
jgi:hypothetical protein